MNNPVRLIDPDGCSAKDIIVKSVVRDDDAYKTQVLDELQKLTSDKLTIDNKGKITILEKAIGSKKLEGTALIRGLIEGFTDANGVLHNKTTTITNENALKDNALATPTDVNLASNGVGSDSKLTYRTDMKAELEVTKNDGTKIKVKQPNFIVIGHELIHAKNNALGQRKVYKTIDDPKVKNEEERDAQEKENILRKENNLPPRP